MQVAHKRHYILAWTVWTIGETCFKLWVILPSKCKQEPLYLWTKLVTDIFHFEWASYSLVVDYTSRFLVVHKLTSMTGQYIATQCQLIFSEYWWPETLISDNRPCYTAEVFTNLMREYNVNHITSSPHYPQSNGLAKKYVQIVKNLMMLKKKGNTCLNV